MGAKVLLLAVFAFNPVSVLENNGASRQAAPRTQAQLGQQEPSVSSTQLTSKGSMGPIVFSRFHTWLE
jgi:hypothetical protein